MSLSRRRYDTLRSVVAGSTVANIQAVERELATLSDTYRVTPDKRKWLLQVVHVTRALDTYLTRLIFLWSHSQALTWTYATSAIQRCIWECGSSAATHA